MPRSSVLLVSAGTALIACCYGFARFAYGLSSPAFTDEFALSPTILGAIGAGSYVGYCVAIGLSTVLTARTGPRNTAVMAGLVAVAGIGTVAAAPSATILFTGVVLAGSSTGLASPPLAAAVSRWVDLKVRDRAQTVINAGTGLGVVLSAPIVLAFVANWRLAWALMAVIAAAVTVFVWRTVPPGSQTNSSPRSRPALRAGAIRLLTASLLTGVGSIAMWNFGRALTADLGPTTSVLAWAMLGAAGVAGAFSGDVVRWAGLPRAWRITITVMTLSTLGYAGLADVTAAVMVAAAAFGAAYIAITGLLLLWATHVFPDRTAFGVGMAFLAIAVGQAISAPVLGAVADASSLPTAFLTAAAVGALALVVTPPSPGPERDAARSHLPDRE